MPPEDSEDERPGTQSAALLSQNYPVSPETRARIEAESRRRCSACFGQYHDIERKVGGVVKLDDNPPSPSSRVAFLCREHYEEFSSLANRHEVERYYDALVAAVGERWTSAPLDLPMASDAQPRFRFQVAIAGAAGGSGGTYGGAGGGGGGGAFGAGGDGGDGGAAHEVFVATGGPRIRISRDGSVLVDEWVSKLYARWITIVAILGAHHIREHPDDKPVAAARVGSLIEAALQPFPRAHETWLELKRSAARDLTIEMFGLDAPDTNAAQSPYEGGAGGRAAWPGGGGGAGGTGLFDGGVGGEGADGAIVIFNFGSNGRLIDIYVLWGTGWWDPPPGTTAVRVIMWGAGGGGAGGGRISTRDPPP